MEKTRRFTPLTFFHLILMLLSMAASIFTVVSIVSGMVSPQYRMYFDTLGGYISIFAIFNLVNALAFICGIIYAWKGYTKQAAGYYKAFILLTMLAAVVLAVLNYMNQGFGTGTVLMIIRIIILAVLAFGKDLGKKRTWMLFWVLVAVDFLYSIISYMFPGALDVTDNVMTVFRMESLFSRLIMDVTIALAIRGKYVDKEARGTK